MKPLLLGLTLLMAAAESHALGQIADVEVLNRDTGQILPVYRAYGECWIAGSPGARYAVMIHSRSTERILAVTSVDGVNVISGETAAVAQTGYVFGPGQQYAIDGWRKSDQEIAAFNFTSLPDSYATRTGREAHVGVIGVALFLEKALPPQIAPSVAAAPDRREHAAADATTRDGLLARRKKSLANEPSAPRLGTGHGAREYSAVTNTDFERRSDRPNEIIRIRYDRYENLVAMGVVNLRPAVPGPTPFLDGGQDRFVPDPPSE